MKYIRVNHVDAEPMAFGEFKAKFPKSGGANIERDPADKGYVITYRKGEPNEYVSWCPKAQFEAAGISADNGLPFGYAMIQCLYFGKKIRRKNWNGIDQYIEYRCVNIKYGEEDRNVNSFAFVFHGKNIHTGETNVQVGWLASQADLAASDWVIVE